MRTYSGKIAFTLILITVVCVSIVTNIVSIMAPRRMRLVRKSRTTTHSDVGMMIARQLRRKAERKFFDSTAVVSVGTSYTINALTQPIVQGTGGGQRTGDNISLLRLHFNYRLDVNSAVAFNDVRLIIVLDKMNDGVAPVYSDLLIAQSITSTFSAQQIKEKRFTILHDQMINVTTGGVSSFMKKKIIPLNQTVSYNDTTNVVTANGKNSMWLFTISDNNTNKPGLNADFQIEYNDF